LLILYTFREAPGPLFRLITFIIPNKGERGSVYSAPCQENVALQGVYGFLGPLPLGIFYLQHLRVLCPQPPGQGHGFGHFPYFVQYLWGEPKRGTVLERDDFGVFGDAGVDFGS
jgi:hypothetical protein